MRVDVDGDEVGCAAKCSRRDGCPSIPKHGNARAPSKEAWGRPVDVLVMRDGALLVSDDTAGAVYRISYGNAKR